MESADERNELVHADSFPSQELSGASSFKISVFVKNLAKLRKCSDTGPKAGKLVNHESRDTEEKSDEGNPSRPP